MSNKYEKLFTPYSIGNMELNNRIVMAPMGVACDNPDGNISYDEITYFQERAKGGAGMIITGCMMINSKVNNTTARLEHDYVIPRLTSLCSIVHQYGTKLCAQISCGAGRNDALSEGHVPMSASANPVANNPNVICRAITTEEIKEFLDDFAAAGTRIKNAGFDAVEIHGHAGYLIDQFMSSAWNRREDQYGGSLENRMRFPVEIVKALRSTVGDIPIIFRIALDHMFEGGRELNEGLDMLKILEKAGVDALDIDVGSYESIDYIFPTTYLGDAPLEFICDSARKVVSIPILNAGSHTPETALDMIVSGRADFAMFGRQFLADPEFPNKLYEGREEDIRPCIRCNEECIGRLFLRSTKLGCSVNPVVLEESYIVQSPAKEAKNIVVIGGGPSGLEAVRTAAVQGHHVILFEKECSLGGQITAAATPEFKNRLKKLIQWYELQLKKLNVKIRLGTEADKDTSELKKADKIIVGIGASPIVLPIKGIDGDHVIGVIDAHLHRNKVKGENIVMVGGGLSGCDCALELAMEGKNVTIIEMQDRIAGDVFYINSVTLFEKLKEYKVTLMPGHKVQEITKEGVITVSKDGKEIKIIGDTVITALGMKSNNAAAKAIQEIYPTKTRIIGDCHEVGKVGKAILAGFNTASI